MALAVKETCFRPCIQYLLIGMQNIPTIADSTESDSEEEGIVFSTVHHAHDDTDVSKQATC